jgi:hypothetical protein
LCRKLSSSDSPCDQKSRARYWGATDYTFLTDWHFALPFNPLFSIAPTLAGPSLLQPSCGARFNLCAVSDYQDSNPKFPRPRQSGLNGAACRYETIPTSSQKNHQFIPPCHNTTTMSADSGETGKAGVIVAPEDAPPMEKLVSRSV